MIIITVNNYLNHSVYIYHEYWLQCQVVDTATDTTSSCGTADNATIEIK